MATNKIDPIPCAHYLSKYLPLTENWIYRTVINHKDFKPIVLCRKKANLQLFPISNLYSLGDFGKVRQYIEIAFFKITGYFYFFKKVCSINGVQILHVHFGYHGVKMTGLKKELNVPMLCSFYGDDAFAYPHVGNNMKAYQHLFKKADKILVLGAYMKAELIKLGCPSEKINIHHLGIDVDKIRFSQRKITREKPIRFLIASSFVPKKGIDLAIKALSGFKDRYQFSLDIIGDGPLKELILNEIKISGIQDRVKLHGYKPYDYFIALAYECDIFIQPSRTTEQNNKEGTPMAIVDAMATGMAVISTRHSDIPEIVRDGESGYLAEENDLASLSQSIMKVFQSPERIESFSLKGRQWVEKEFDAKKQTLKLEEYYSELIRKHSS
jgi:colanic acid/amylovoran biosynthesis glycosyltransferase